jgi:hypothetical protein
MTMIKLLPAFYLSSAMLTVVVLVLLAMVLLLPSTRKFSRFFVWAFVSLLLAFAVSTLALAQYCGRLELKVQSVSLGASRAEVLALLGSPTERYEPAIGVGGKPDPNLAVYFYTVSVPPFQQEYRLEFADDKLISKPQNDLPRSEPCK